MQPGTPLPEDKRAVRRRVLAQRRELPERALTEAADAVAGALAPVLAGCARVASYRPLPHEPRPPVVAGALLPVLLPVLLPDGDLDWELDGQRLGRDAIASVDLVLVPAVAVDRQGVRLGRGGGSYDRALRRTSARTVAVLHDGELVERLPAEPHDVAVGWVVTPTGGLVGLPS